MSERVYLVALTLHTLALAGAALLVLIVTGCAAADEQAAMDRANAHYALGVRCTVLPAVSCVPTIFELAVAVKEYAP